MGIPESFESRSAPDDDDCWDKCHYKIGHYKRRCYRNCMKNRGWKHVKECYDKCKHKKNSPDKTQCRIECIDDSNPKKERFTDNPYEDVYLEGRLLGKIEFSGNPKIYRDFGI